MLRSTLLAFALLALVAPLPAASAQVADQTTTEVRLGTLEEPLTPGEPRTVPGVVRYTYTFMGSAAFTGTSIHLKVVEAPEWAEVVITPQELVIPVNGGVPGVQMVYETAFKVTVRASKHAPDGESGIVRVQADAAHNSPLKPSSGSSAMLVATASDSACTAESFSVQGFGAEPAAAGLSPVQLAAAAGMAGTAGLAGFLMGRRAPGRKEE